MTMKKKLPNVTDRDIANRFGVSIRYKINPSYHEAKVRFNRSNTTLKLDCHGMTVQFAYELCRQFLQYHFDLQTKSVTIITGRSGIINVEFPTWMEFNQSVRNIKQCENKGSWIVNLKSGKIR